VRKQFTGYERDREIALDFAEARTYSQIIGRFTAVDPLRESAKPEVPQTLNRYIYCVNNPLILVDPSGALPDDYYIADNGNISVEKTGDSFDRFFVFDENSGSYSQVAQLERNEAGLVNFPASGYGFGRYSNEEVGGVDATVGETVGQGDHWLRPDAAAALFGLTNQLHNDFGINNISLGDMSSSNGSDPWDSSQANATPDNGHHEGHGHGGNRSGMDVDFRYVGIDGNSKAGDFNITFTGNKYEPVTTNGFDPLKNQNVFTVAQSFGFTRNFQGVGLTMKGAEQHSGHTNHGHLGYVPGAVPIRVKK
jgi:RHS repeat-associated protein